MTSLVGFRKLFEFIFSSDIKTVAVSGMWESLSSVCSSCGFAVEVLSGGLKLTVPYNRGLCVEIEVLWALLWLKLETTSFDLKLLFTPFVYL